MPAMRSTFSFTSAFFSFVSLKHSRDKCYETNLERKFWPEFQKINFKNLWPNVYLCLNLKLGKKFGKENSTRKLWQN
jgi:hypothetical protein